jgi:hypothetical protein
MLCPGLRRVCSRVSETMAAAFRPSFLNKKLKDLNPMAVLEPAVFAARSRQLWNRYRTTYLNTGSFAPVIHATVFFGSMGWFATWRVKGGMYPVSVCENVCLCELLRQVSSASARRFTWCAYKRTVIDV